jgi:hypothetical protein
MKRMIQTVFAASIWVALQATPAWATIDRVFGDDTCRPSVGCANTIEYPVLQGQTTDVTVVGQFVDLARAVEVTGSGVSVSTVSTDSSKRKLQIAVNANAEPGLRTIKLRYLVEASGPDTFKIRVLRKGQVTSVIAPSPDEFFNEATVTLEGQNIGNAVVTPAGSVVASHEVLENTESRLRLRVRFNGGPLAEASFDVRLRDASCASPCPLVASHQYKGENNSTNIPVKILGPNAVSEITFPNGANVTQGSLLTFRIKLVRPSSASSKRGTATTRLGQTLPTFTQPGDVVRWSLVNRNLFEPAPGSGTTFDPNVEQNSVRIPPGDQFVTLSVRLRQAPSGCPEQGCTGTLITRMGNFNTDQPPFRKDATFTMFPPQN